MATTLLLDVAPNRGYASGQVKNRATLAQILDEVQTAIHHYGEDAEVVTYDGSNAYGAKFGSIFTFGAMFYEEADSDEDGDF